MTAAAWRSCRSIVLVIALAAIMFGGSFTCAYNSDVKLDDPPTTQP